MPTPLPIAAGLLLGLAVAAIGCGKPAPDRPLLIDQTERDIGSVAVGSHAVTFDIHNPNTTPRRILGVNAGCRGTACFYTRHGEVVTIGPGETFHYTTDVIVTASGPFESSMELYLEDGGTRAVTLSVRGVATEPP